MAVAREMSSTPYDESVVTPSANHNERHGIRTATATISGPQPEVSPSSKSASDFRSARGQNSSDFFVVARFFARATQVLSDRHRSRRIQPGGHGAFDAQCLDEDVCHDVRLR